MLESPARPVEYVPLFFFPDRNHPSPAALGPAGLKYDMVTLVGIARLEFHCRFAAQAEGLLQLIQFALATGCRMSEILHLDWRRVDFIQSAGRVAGPWYHQKW